jgi:hypothetical protein
MLLLSIIRFNEFMFQLIKGILIQEVLFIAIRLDFLELVATLQ